MKQYIGTKVINAKEMTRQEYNKLRGWEVPQDEDPADEGYLVEYVDGGQANHPDFKGYISWSPKEVFERAYKPSGSLSFGDAIVYLKAGMKMTRKGWNGRRKDGSPMYVFLVQGSTFKVNRPPLLGIFEEGHEIEYKPHLDMCHADDSIGVWQAVTNDVLAEDWEVVE